MFLKDQLIEIGRACDITDTSNYTATALRIKMACNRSLIDGVGKNKTDVTILAQKKRVIRASVEAIKELREEGYVFLDENLYKTYIDKKFASEQQDKD